MTQQVTTVSTGKRRAGFAKRA